MNGYGKAGKARRAALVILAFAIPIYGIFAQATSGGSMQGSSPGAAAVDNQRSISGSIGRINGQTVFVLSDDGTVTTVAVSSGTLILGRKLAALDSIQAGEALGVAATKGADGSLTATAINVFPPELWQRVRKGQFPMASGQVMTNAQVTSLGGGGVAGRVLSLKYEMLTASIAVPEGAEIHRSVAMKLADLKPGLKVTVRGTGNPDGSLAASFFSLDLPDR
jgi:hypothetical protein